MTIAANVKRLKSIVLLIVTDSIRLVWLIHPIDLIQPYLRYIQEAMRNSALDKCSTCTEKKVLHKKFSHKFEFDKLFSNLPKLTVFGVKSDVI